MGFNFKAFLNTLLQLLTLGKQLGLFDKNGNPINSLDDLHAHALGLVDEGKEEKNG